MENEDVTIETKAAYWKITTHQATNKTVTEKVLVKEASYKLEVVPGSFGTENLTYIAKEDASKLRVIPATFKPSSETIETKPATASDKAPDCESSDPNDCRYWCYKPIASEFVSIPLTKLNTDATTKRTTVPGFNKTYTKTVVANELTTRRIEIPEVTKVILVSDSSFEEITVPAEYKTVTKEVLVQKGDLTSWK